ncbi:MAG: hypothetical protein AMXMBFR84_04360 [Candidatus Hydrogenedentota bacterium]
MNDKKLQELLSAYLDGESDDAEAVRGMLEKHPEAFRRYREYTALSESLRALPRAEADAAFSTRVMAHVREARPAPRFRVWRLLAPVFATAAAVTIGFQTYRMQPAPAPSANDRLVLEMSSMSDQELDALLSELSRELPEASTEIQTLPLHLAMNTAAEPEAVPSADELAYVADLDASFATAADLGYGGTLPDLDSLNDEEASQLYDALLTETQEG